jgi:acyl carrier protein
MINNNVSAGPRTLEEISSWLVERVAFYVERPSREIDPHVSVTEAGLDSVYAFALCGEIEDQFGLAVEPEQMWELDTLTALAAHLAELTPEFERKR